MSKLVLACSMLAVLAMAPAALASGSAPSPPPRQEPPPSEASPAGFGHGADSTLVPGRADAEKDYAKGWEISEDAKKDLAAGKADSAKKKFGKALKKFKSAVDTDPTYFEAWNMVGFCSRKSGDLKRSFEAYEKCLLIQPEYAQAHEYLGEAYLMKGDLAKAKEQLLWLVSRKSEQAGELATKIDEFQKGGNGAAQSDSTAKGGGW
ncbi:MAG TPA: tetratricopeptide repeat protein [Candidatus Binatia bacterium]|nr:tetratricopeptide repeat protein [Candidatus Binatia bacterium]